MVKLSCRPTSALPLFSITFRASSTATRWATTRCGGPVTFQLALRQNSPTVHHLHTWEGWGRWRAPCPHLMAQRPQDIVAPPSESSLVPLVSPLKRTWSCQIALKIRSKFDYAYYYFLFCYMFCVQYHDKLCCFLKSSSVTFCIVHCLSNKTPVEIDKM